MTADWIAFDTDAGERECAPSFTAWSAGRAGATLLDAYEAGWRGAGRLAADESMEIRCKHCGKRVGTRGVYIALTYNSRIEKWAGCMECRIKQNGDLLDSLAEATSGVDVTDATRAEIRRIEEESAALREPRDAT